MNGLGGEDILNGFGSTDHLNGGNGDDTCNGGPSEDFINCGSGFDTIDGGPGNDTMNGRAGYDTINGGGGNDTIDGWYGNDLMKGDDGNDQVFGGPGADNFQGFAQSATASNNDTVHGQDGNDYMVGGSGVRYGDGDDDFLSASGGDARFFAGPGNDQLSAGTFVSRDVGFTQVAIGGPGEDRFGVTAFLGPLGSKQPPDDITYEAVDGEHDTITCWDVKKETVRADPLHTFPQQVSFGIYKAGRQYCDSLTIVK